VREEVRERWGRSAVAVAGRESGTDDGMPSFPTHTDTHTHTHTHTRTRDYPLIPLYTSTHTQVVKRTVVDVHVAGWMCTQLEIIL
jgi:hypothetical protein